MTEKTVWALPASWYHDPDVFARERERIFAREWLWVGCEHEVAEPGHYLTARPGGYPILVARDPEGELRAFHNVCRHRASPLLTERTGHCAGLVCPYHGWRYRWDGALDIAPNFGEAEDFPRASLGLFPVRIATWSGAVFVTLSDDAPSLESRLAPFRDAFELVAPAQRTFHRELSFEVACNWKNYIDNYQEGYHIPLVHPTLRRDLQWTRYRVTNLGTASLHDAPPAEGSGQPGVFGWLFPNFAFNAYGSGISFMRMEPLAPDRTRLVYAYYRPTDVSPDRFEKEVVDYAVQVSLEDQAMTPRVQQNLQAGIYEAGPLSPRHEQGLHHFHEQVRNALAEA